MPAQNGELTPRQRVLAAVERREPDQVPIDVGGLISGISVFAYARLLKHWELDLPVNIYNMMEMLADPAEEVLQRLGTDFRYLRAGPPDSYQMAEAVFYDASHDQRAGYATGEDQPTYVDQWGITWRRAAYYCDMVGHPLQGRSFQEIKQYKFPDPDDPGRWRGLREQARALYENTDYAIAFAMDSGGFLEMGQWLCGFEDFFEHLGREDKIASYVLDGMADYLTAFWSNCLDIVGPFVQVIQFGDDYGMQDRMQISPTMWRRHIKPRYAQLLGRIKPKAGVKVYHHSCGSIFPIIPDLAEIGVDIINPVQPRAKDMESHKLKAAYGDLICFHGGIDEQWALPFGTAHDVREEVERRIEAFAPGGGYILAPAHNIQPDVPVDNILALFEAAKEYGRYPIGSGQQDRRATTR
jgi:uroporphyrinogen decarboxylase